MKILLTIFILLTLNITTSVGCDVCGCSLGSNYFGILPQYDQHFIGLRWHYSSFLARMNHNSEYLENEYSHDTYQKFEWWGRFYLTERIQLFASIPYSYNRMNGSHQRVTASGIGDISLLVNYAIVNTGEDVGNPWRHTWLMGGGIKLPTGDFRQEDQGRLINPNFQLGTGSTDFTVNTIYTVRFNNVGLSMSATQQINTINPEGYRFGHQRNISGQLFFWHKIKALSLLPNAGVYYETGAMHTDHGIQQTNTGGEAWFAQAGLEVYYRQAAVGFTFQQPISQKMNSDQIADIEARERTVLSLIYNF